MRTCGSRTSTPILVCFSITRRIFSELAFGPDPAGADEPPPIRPLRSAQGQAERLALGTRHYRLLAADQSYIPYLL